MTAFQIPTAAVFRPLLEPARCKGAYGGRGSGKSHFFGELMVEECLRVPATRAVCIREVQKSLIQSSKRMIEIKDSKPGRWLQIQGSSHARAPVTDRATG
jgi:phage terminase large subunit